METQITALCKSVRGYDSITIFGYSTNGIPGLEVNSVGKQSKYLKEKLIYLTRLRKLQIPLKRIVISIDLNEVSALNGDCLKWLEFPFLLMYWQLCGLIPIKKLESCLAAGWFTPKGEIYLMPMENKYSSFMGLTYIGEKKQFTGEVNIIESSQLLEHIPQLTFKLDQIDKDSAIPTKSAMT